VQVSIKDESCMGLIYITRVLVSCGIMDEELDDKKKRAGS
jgi:hypothetical protein